MQRAWNLQSGESLATSSADRISNAAALRSKPLPGVSRQAARSAAGTRTTIYPSARLTAASAVRRGTFVGRASIFNVIAKLKRIYNEIQMYNTWHRKLLSRE